MWWEEYPIRYRKEVDLIRRHHPGVNLVLSQVPQKYCPVCSESIQPARLHLAGLAKVTTRLGSSYPIIMVYPCNFPNRLPGVWPLRDLNPRPGHHQYANERLCLTENENDPAIYGSHVLTWAFGWLNCYDIWRKTGNFPATNYGKHRV